MSIYTEETLAIAAYESCRARGVDIGASAVPRIRTMIPAALELLSDRVKEGKDYARGQKDFTITAADGFIDLSDEEHMLFDFHKASVSQGGVYLERVDDLYTLQNGDLPTDNTYYAEDGRGLRVRSTSGELDDYDEEVVVKSNYVFSLTDEDRPLPDYFDGAALNTLVGMVIARPQESMEAAA